MCLLPLFPHIIVNPATRVPFFKCNLYQITSQLMPLHWLPFSSQLKLPRSFQGLTKSNMTLFFAFLYPYFLVSLCTIYSCHFGLLSETYSYFRVFLLATTFACNSLPSDIPMPHFITFCKSLIKSPLTEIFFHPSFSHPQQLLFSLTLLYSQWMIRTFWYTIFFLSYWVECKLQESRNSFVHCYPYLLKYCLT